MRTVFFVVVACSIASAGYFLKLTSAADSGAREPIAAATPVPPPGAGAAHRPRVGNLHELLGLERRARRVPPEQ